MTNEELGYNAFFETNRHTLNLGEFSPARVIAEHKGAYKVKNADGEYFAKVIGKDMFHASSREDYPAVGDWVTIKEQDKEWAVITGILPRKTVIKRKYTSKSGVQIIATNIDVAFVVESIGRDFNLNRFERYFTIADSGGVKATIILNKIDLIPKEELDLTVKQIKDRFKDIAIIVTSALTGTGLEELRSYIEPRKTYCFLGSSGVGKSSLINKLLEEEAIETKEVGLYTNRGKHTTTSREMYFLKNKGIVIDNPGMKGVGMTDTDDGLENVFAEIEKLAEQCKFADCTHTSEPGCNVSRAVRSGALDRKKYLNYIRLKKETESYVAAKIRREEKANKTGKFIKKQKKK